MSEGVRCRSCGLDNEPGRDFCERCGEYLAWAPTSMVAAVPEPELVDDDQSSGESSEPAGAAPVIATEDAPSGEAATGEEPTRVLHEHEADDHAEQPPPSEPGSGEPAAREPTGTQQSPNGGAAPSSPPPKAPPTAAPATSSEPLPPPPPPPEDVLDVPEVPPATGDASLVLLPADPLVGVGVVPAIDTTSTLSFRATIRNESQIVDNYDLSVLGLPEGWSVVAPMAAFLVPLGSGRGDSELEVQIDVTPPRDYRSTAGIWTFELIALSRTHATVAARAIAQFEVRPFESWSVEVVPTVNAGRLKARYRTAVRNDGNAEQSLWPVAIDDSGKLRTGWARGRMTLDAGEVGSDTLTLRPRFPKPVGRVTEHRVGVDVVGTEPEVAETELTLKEKAAAKAKQEAKKTASGVKVTAKGIALPRPRLPKFKNPLAKLKPDAAMLSRLRGGGADPTAPVTARQVVFRQKPLIPLWVLGVLLLCAIAAVLIYLLLPQKTTVPLLTGQPDAFTAEKLLRGQDLVLSQPVQRRVEPDADAGSVIAQSPAGGTKVDKDSSVSIVVADGATKVDVPRLKGLTRVKADERLREEGLELGTTQPTDAPDSFVVRSQIPDAGLSVDRGTAVRVFLRKPVLTAKEKAAAAKKKKAAAAAAAAAKAKAKKKAAATVTIPKFKGKSLKAYLAALDKLGLRSRVNRAVAASSSGTILGVKPEPGKKAKKGDLVTVRASSGPPAVAVQTPSRVVFFNAAAGKELFRLPGAAAEPSFFPNGKQLIYRSGRRILVAGTTKGATPRAVYSGSDDLVRPTMAPDGTTLAVIQRLEGDGDLCFGRVNPSTAGVTDIGQLCLPDDGWDLNGRISWRKDGRMVLVPARRRSDPSVFAVRAYRTSRAFTTDPLLWRGSTATPVSSGGKGVRTAVFSPGGTRIAAISNIETDAFEVVFTAADDLKLEAPDATETKACDIAWRSDAKELVALQADDLCSEGLGKIVRFGVGKPKETDTVASRGRNPAYRP